MVEDNKIQISEESLRELFSGSVPQEVSNFVAGLQKVSPADLTDILSANPELFSVLTNVPEKAQIAAAEKLGRKVLPLIRGTAPFQLWKCSNHGYPFQGPFWMQLETNHNPKRRNSCAKSRVP